MFCKTISDLMSQWPLQVPSLNLCRRLGSESRVIKMRKPHTTVVCNWNATLELGHLRLKLIFSFAINSYQTKISILIFTVS